MAEPRPIRKRGIAGAVLLLGAAVAFVVLRAKNTPLRVPAETAAPATEAPTVASAPARSSPPDVPTPAPSAVATGAAVDLGPALLEAKKVDEARAALEKGEPKAALAALDSYEKVVRGPGALRHEATMLRIQALSKVGRRTDAKALAMAVRDDPAWGPDEQTRVEDILSDAGL